MRYDILKPKRAFADAEGIIGEFAEMDPDELIPALLMAVIILADNDSRVLEEAAHFLSLAEVE